MQSAREFVRRKAKVCASFIVFQLVSGNTIAAQVPRPLVIVGRVTDDKTQEALADVVVSLSTGAEARTGSTGRFVINAPREGRLLLRFRRIGYDPGAMPVDVVAGDTTRVDVTLARSDERAIVASADTAKTQLDTVSVRAPAAPAVAPRLQEFEDRRTKWANALFVTRADIEKHVPTQLTDIFRGMSQVQIVGSGGTKFIASQRGMKSTLYKPLPTASNRAMSDVKEGTCVLRTGVDGFIKEAGFDINSIAPEEVHGIEVFPGPSSIPAKYGGMRQDMYCGLVMIWTR